MVKNPSASFLAASTLAAGILAACSGNASPAPTGSAWHALPGVRDRWSRGNSVALQTYEYSQASFSGMLQDLASQVTVNALLRNPGARLRGSVPLSACPGAAGVASFTLRGGRLLQEGFAVRQGQAIRTVYVRPGGAPPDGSVVAAMRRVLC